MCAITVCGSLTSFMEPVSSTSLARLLWPIISSVTFTVKLSGISSGRHSISIERVMTSSNPPCTFTPAGSPAVCTGTVTRMRLVEIDALEIGVQQRALDRVHLVVHHHDRGSFAAGDREREDGVEAGGGTDDFGDFAGVDRDADGVLVGAVQHCRNVSGGTRTACFILTARGTHLGGYGNIFSQLHISFRAFEVRFA